MADGGGLENRYGVKPIVGSNPTPSAPAVSQDVGDARTRAAVRTANGDRLPVQRVDDLPGEHV